MIKQSVLVLSILTLALACSPLAEDRDLGRSPLGKTDSLGSCAAPAGGDFCGGISDGNCWCDESCSSFGDCCPDKPAVCGAATFDPCADLACGDTCSTCDPNDANCFETAEVKVCGSNGICSGAVANCSATYQPCDGLSCGDECSLCDPTDPNCFETAVIKLCDASGSCQASVPSCDGGACCSPQDAPTCFEGATCCDDGTWSCNDGAGNSTCPVDGNECQAADLCEDFQAPCQTATDCGDGFSCVADPSTCSPSACGCDPATGSVTCTSDCGGAVCVPDQP